MERAYIKNLGFWMHMYMDSYKEGVDLAKKIIEMADKQSIVDSNKNDCDAEIDFLVNAMDENGINTDIVDELFERRPDYLLNKDEPIGMPIPEKESY